MKVLARWTEFRAVPIPLLCFGVACFLWMACCPSAAAVAGGTTAEFDRAVAEYKNGNVDAAMDRFRAVAAKEDALGARARLRMAYILMEKEKVRDAAQHFVEAVRGGLPPEDMARARYFYHAISVDAPEAFKDVKRAVGDRFVEEEPRRWSLSAGLEIEYVDGIAGETILDPTTKEPVRVDDWRNVYSLGARFRDSINRRYGYSLKYSGRATDYYDRNAQNFFSNRFVGQLHRSLAGQKRIAVNLFGGLGYLGSSYQSLNNSDIGLGLAFSNRILKGRFKGLRYTVSGSLADLDYADTDATDGDQTIAGLNLSYPLPCGNGFRLHAGLRYTWFDAGDDAFSHDGYAFSPGISYRGAKDAVRLTGRFSAYGYDGFDNIQTTDTREDDSAGVSLSYERDLMRNLSLSGTLSYRDNDSNIERQAYTMKVFNVGLRYAF